MDRVTPAGPRLKVQIRWLIHRDMPEVLAIDAASFGLPWGEAEFLRRLRSRNCIGMVAERDAEILGFMVFDLKTRAVSLARLAVRPDRRRRGVGRQMVAKLVAMLSPERRTRIDLRCREANLGGLLFLRSRGFLATDVEREHYLDTGEDAFVMRYFLEDEGDGR